MKTPKVSIITPTHYRPDLLRACIQVIQKQDWDDYEHIIVADHCPYAKKVVDEFKEDKHIIYAEVLGAHEKNAGAPSKNRGIELARGKYIAYCDDDNRLLPNHTRIMYEFLEKKGADGGQSCFFHVCDRPEESPLERGNGRTESILNYPLDWMPDRGRKPPFEWGSESWVDIGGGSRPEKDLNDNLSLVHKKSLHYEVFRWHSKQELINLNQHSGEDRHVMERIKRYGENFAYLDEVTAIYFSGGGCQVKDGDYLKGLPGDALAGWESLH